MWSLYIKNIYIYIYIYEWTHMHTHTDMMTPTGLMRWELICDSDGATFVKSDSQLQQPGWRDNSLPVRLCVHRPVCVCTCTRVCLWARTQAAVCVNISRHVVSKSEYQVPILIYLPYISIQWILISGWSRSIGPRSLVWLIWASS